MTKITMELPEEITKEAQKRGIDLKEIKKRLQTFAINSKNGQNFLPKRLLIYLRK
jgi:hypothetical protein